MPLPADLPVAWSLLPLAATSLTAGHRCSGLGLLQPPPGVFLATSEVGCGGSCRRSGSEVPGSGCCPRPAHETRKSQGAAVLLKFGGCRLCVSAPCLSRPPCLSSSRSSVSVYLHLSARKITALQSALFRKNRVIAESQAVAIACRPRWI